MMADDLGITVNLTSDLDTSEARVRTCLSAEGFGVLTEIDVQATLQSKIGVSIDGYRILGACNPHLAHRAIAVDPQVGLLLPCNVVLAETAEGTRVEFANPLALLALADSRELHAIATEARERLDRVAQALSRATPAGGATE